MVIRKIQGMAGSFALAWVLESVKEKLSGGLPALLDGIGGERLAYMVKNGVTLWQVWEDKDIVLGKLVSYKDDIDNINLNDIADVVLEVIREECPRYRVLPRQWILQNLLAIKRDLQAYLG